MKSEIVPTTATWLIGLAAIVVIAYDMYAVYSTGEIETISGTFRRVASQYPVLPFLLGMLVMHLLQPIIK